MSGFFRITSLRAALGEVSRLNRFCTDRLKRKRKGKSLRFSLEERKIYEKLLRTNPKLADFYVGGSLRLRNIKEAMISKVREKVRSEATRIYQELHFSKKKLGKKESVYLQEKLALLQQLCPHRRMKSGGGACIWCMQE